MIKMEGITSDIESYIDARFTDLLPEYIPMVRRRTRQKYAELRRLKRLKKIKQLAESKDKND